MTCKNCGASLPDNAKFCGHCGTACTPEQTSQVETTPLYGYENFTEETQSAQIPPQPVNSPPVPPVPPVNPPTPKKKHKGLRAFGIILAVIVIVCGVLFACRNQILRLALGETNYYVYSEFLTVKDLLSDKDFGGLIHNGEAQIDADGNLNVYSENFSATLNGSYNVKDAKSTFDFNAKYGGAKVGDFEFNLGDKKAGLSAPSMTDKELAFPLDFTKADTSQVKKLVTKALPIIKKVEKENKDCIKVSHEKINGKRCRVVTYELTEEDLYNIGADFLDELANDEALQETIKELAKDNADIIDTYVEYFEDDDVDVEDVLDEFFDNLSEYADELRGEAEYEKDNEYSVVYAYKIAYSDSNTVCQRAFSSKYTSVEENTTLSSKNEITVDSTKTRNETKIFAKENHSYKNSQYPEEDESESLDILTYTKKKTGKTTEAKLIINNSVGDEIIIKATDLAVENVNGVNVPVGKIEFSYYDINGTIDLTADDKFAAKLNVTEDGEEVVKATINAELSDKADFSDYNEPSDSGDEIEEFIDAVGTAIENSFEEEGIDY